MASSQTNCSDESGKCPDREKCLNILNMVIDGEATAEQEQYLKTHIDECLPCLENYKLEKEIKDLLNSRCSKVKVPEGLAESIRSKLGEKAI